MKKYILVMGLLSMGLMLPSCGKFLDIQPVGKVIPTSTQEYRELLTSAYRVGLADKGFTEFRTDAAVVRNNSYDKSAYGELQVWNDNTTNSNAQEWGWAAYYSAIYYANAVIDKANTMTGGSAEERNQLVGEAYMLRAMLHFTLVNLYGEPYTKAGAPASRAIPLKLDLDLEVLPSKATVAEVYQSVLNDIAMARKLLNKTSWEEALSYRFTTISADALEARVLLYQARWSEALAVSERVLAAKSSIADLTISDVKLPNLYNSVETITAYEHIINTAVGRAIKATPEFYDSYSSDDVRKVLFFGSKSSQGDYYDVIKSDGSTTYRNSFRTAEFYLTSAEAAAQSGNLVLARQRLSELLEKRYTSSAYVVKRSALNTMTKDQLVAEILSERKKELIFEGHYWFDLRRTGRPAITKVVDGKSYSLSVNDARYTLPIPKVAIESNPSLLN